MATKHEKAMILAILMASLPTFFFALMMLAGAIYVLG